VNGLRSLTLLNKGVNSVGVGFLECILETQVGILFLEVCLVKRLDVTVMFDKHLGGLNLEVLNKTLKVLVLFNEPVLNSLAVSRVLADFNSFGLDVILKLLASDLMTFGL